MELTLGLAFIAGIVSFLSPCVLPLVPAYVGYMGGRVTTQIAAEVRSGESALRQQKTHFTVVLHGLAFVAGFTLVFVAIGLLSTAFIQQIGGNNLNLVTAIIGRVGGVVIVFFGLHFMGAVPRFFAWVRRQEGLLNNVLISVLIALLSSLLIAWSLTGTGALWTSSLWETAPAAPTLATVLIAFVWLGIAWGGGFTHPNTFWGNIINRVEIALYSDTRRQFQASGRQGLGGSALMGVVFSAGWTPCIGPVYGAVLTLAASGGDVSRAGTLLTAYSLGLGVPFLLTALMLDRAQGVLRKLQRQMRTIELLSGTFLIIIGLSVASGQLQNLSARFAGDFAEFSTQLEESVLAFFSGEDDIVFETGDDRPVAANEQTTATVGLDIGNLAPDFQTVTDAGEPIALSDLRGQIVLLNFWATWCGPCRVEMPALQERFAARARDGFTILAVNNGESAATVRDFRQEFDLTFPLALDKDTRIQAQYGLFSYPSTLLLDQNGVIVARHFGLLTADQIDQWLADVL